jgi:hypothetical protein
MATAIRVAGVPVERWRESARRVYGEATLSRVLWRAEIAAYTAVAVAAVGAEEVGLDLAGGMACGLQEYAEERAEEGGNR